MKLLFYPELFNFQHKDEIKYLFNFIIKELSQGAELRDEFLYVIRQGETPMCSRAGYDKCIICLVAEGDSWCQYAYQFAHEFCHWLINGTLSGKREGLYWFEKTVCELASCFVLSRIESEWNHMPEGVKTYSSDFYSYLHYIIGRITPAPLPLSEYIKNHHSSLYSQEYHRELYSNMALALLPSFLYNPRLWLLLPYFGDLKSFDYFDDWLLSVQHRIPEHLTYELNTLRSLLL